MKVERLESWHLPALALQAGPQSEQMGVANELTAETAQTLRSYGRAWAALVGGEVVAAAGVVAYNEWRGEAWAILSRSAGRHMVALTRRVLMFLETTELQRVELSVRLGFREGERWARLLGFKFEGDMPGYGADGSTFGRWGRVRHG